MTTATAAAALAALITVMTLLFTGACTPDASRDGPGRATSTGAAPATEFGSAEPTGARFRTKVPKPRLVHWSRQRGAGLGPSQRGVLARSLGSRLLVHPHPVTCAVSRALVAAPWYPVTSANLVANAFHGPRAGWHGGPGGDADLGVTFGKGQPRLGGGVSDRPFGSSFARTAIALQNKR